MSPQAATTFATSLSGSNDKRSSKVHHSLLRISKLEDFLFSDNMSAMPEMDREKIPEQIFVTMTHLSRASQHLGKLYTSKVTVSQTPKKDCVTQDLAHNRPLYEPLSNPCGVRHYHCRNLCGMMSKSRSYARTLS